ncbi:MAG: 50S ribosomal protein L4 [candidate division Zixibacteria bacterium]|nr:50S ribosomal protein L4 [Candidatus Tariuqbacter arcticus]
MKTKVYDIEGNPTGEEFELPASVFDIEPNDHALALTVQSEMANRRQGTHSTKGRSEVRGGGRKPWRQKGRGVARAGTNRSPIWRGGGITFGPKPHKYCLRVNKKVNRLARRSAFTYKARENNITVLNDFNWEEGRTANARNLLKAFAIDKGNVLLLTTEYSSTIYQACCNMPGFEVNKAVAVSARQILKSNTIFIQKGAVASLREVLDK